MSRVLIISTSGIKSDGITSWMKQTVSAMDLTGLSFETIAWKDADREVMSAIAACGVNIEVLPNRQTNLLGYVRELAQLLANRRFDIVHVCGSSGLTGVELALARTNGVPRRICHSHNTSCQHAALDRFFRPIMYACATDLVACGIDAGRWLFGNRAFTVIPNGKDIGLYEYDFNMRRSMRKSLGLEDGQVAIGHVGRFNRQKNHGKLVEIMSELRKRSDRYVLFLVGDGALEDEVRREVEQTGLSTSVTFLGFRSDVPALLNAMDCMVFPSLYEGFPNVVLEWQINGLPCVISNSVTRECAITPLVRFMPLAGPTSVWADAIEDVLKKSNREHDSANAALAAVEEGYDITKNAEMLREFYLEGVWR